MAHMPQVTGRRLVRFLKAQGFVEDRQSGAHLTFGTSSEGGSSSGIRLMVDVRNDTIKP
jgi:predicted RNA binding protein YcfA (HicA-like mRNA interferase family)